MKMYKRIFGVLLCLCMLLGAVSLASAEENGATTGGSQTEEGQTGSGQTHENHPICGATHTDIGDHTPCAPITTWTKLYMDEDGKLYYGDDQLVDDTQGNYYTLGEGNYYLDTNVSVTKEIRVTGNVTLCLNGHDLTQASTGSNLERLLEVGDGTNVAVLNICNCDPTEGSIALTTSDEYPTIDVNSGCTLNLFSGKINRENGTGTTVHLGTGAKTAKATLNMYGGEINQRAANNAVEARVAVGTYAINIYAGTITVNNFNGIQATNAHETEIRIAGGSIEAGGYAINIDAKVSLTLSGSPTLKGSDADIYLPANSHFTVTDDFTIGTDSVISVMQALGSNEKGVFAKPAASGSSLAEKAKYFVSAETGYCVTTSGNDLQLTPCEITTQPTADNSYTVTANGTTAPTYQWYTATREAVPATDKNATDKGNYYWDGKWGISKSAASISNEPIFSIDMKKGDTLALLFDDRDTTVDSASISDATGANKVEKSYLDMTVVTDPNWPYSRKMQCILTAPEDGAYTLKLSARGFSMEETEWTSLSFTATVTGDVPNLEQALNGGTTLNTTNLCKGPYICRVTWQGETGKGATTIIDSNPVTLNKEQHTGGTATCTEKAICTTCGQPYGDLDTNNHSWNDPTYVWNDLECTAKRVCARNSEHVEEETKRATQREVTQNRTCTQDELATFVVTFTNTAFAEQTKENVKTADALNHNFATTWSSDETNHWHACQREGCQARSDEGGHTGGTATCQAKAKCEMCDTLYGALGEHNFDETKWGYQGTDGHAHKCTNTGCDEHDTVIAHTSSGAATEEVSETCTECGYVINAKLPHSHNWQLVPAAEATCVSTGKTEHYKCTGCSALSVKTGDVYTETTDEALTTPVDADKHDITHYDEKLANCTEKGHNAYDKCSRCSYTTYQETNALGHDFENGTYVYDDTQHWKKCSRCDVEDTGHKTTHTEVTDEAKPATTTETGLTEGKHCDVCGKVLVAQEVTPKLTPRYYYNSTTTTTKDTTKKDNTKSPGTFDPGVGVYALTAVLSVTGMAWVGRKKH